MAALLPPPADSASAKDRFLRILYADDVAELRDIVQVLLKRDGHGVECVEDGRFAFNRVAMDSGFDLVITDHHMPNLDGLGLVRKLRELHYAGQIMVVSSELAAAVHEEYERLGVDRILYKPVHPAALRRTVAELSSSGGLAPAPSFSPDDTPPARAL